MIGGMSLPAGSLPLSFPSRRSRVPALALAACLAALCATAFAAPEDHGLSSERLRRLDAAVEKSIADGRLAGGIIHVARDGKTAYQKAYGMQDREAGTAMREDAIFRIASMSKAITTTAAMILYEEGRFRLHDPVGNFIPGFKNSVVAVAPAADAPTGTRYSTVPARRPITIHDLMTHTAGLTYGDGPAVEDYKKAGLHGWYFANKDETIGDAVDRLAALPLHGQPGEAWQYGFSTDVLGRVIEVASGVPLDRFIEERVTGPLGMVDTCFFLPPEKAGRLAPVYGYTDGRLVKTEDSSKTDYIHGPRRCFSGGAGLLSTVHDYARFLQMLLNEGTLDGTRILSRKSVELMRTNAIGDKYQRDTDGFGLGFWVIRQPGAYGELGSRGAFGWGSAYYPQYLVDPQERMVAFFMTQLMPTGGLDLNQRFKVLVYQALED